MINKHAFGITIILIALAGVLAESCSSQNLTSQRAISSTWSLSSKAFAQGQRIPVLYTACGGDLSPPLSWSAPPEKARALALICDDPDAPSTTWVHWVIYDIPATEGGLRQGIPKVKKLSSGAKQGENSFHRTGYNGPSPPPGALHRYFFKLYALDADLNLVEGLTKGRLLKAMEGHVLAQASLMGTYGR